MIKIKSIEIHGNITDYKAYEKLAKLTQSNDIQIGETIKIINCKNIIKITKNNNIEKKLNNFRTRLRNITKTTGSIYFNTQTLFGMHVVMFKEVKPERFFFFKIDNKKVSFKKDGSTGIVDSDNSELKIGKIVKFKPFDDVWIHN